MKRKLLSIVLMVMSAMFLCACGSAEVPEEPEKIDKSEEVMEETVNDVTDIPDKSEDKSQNEMIYLYYSEDAMTFTTEEVEVTAVQPEEILKELAKRNFMDEGVKILEFSVEELDGKKVINLDLSSEFSHYLSSMGTAGEYYILGGLCNSFLCTYECEQIKVTVNGKSISTGHSDSLGYHTMFE